MKFPFWLQRFIEGVAIILVPSLLAYTVGRHGAEHASGTLFVMVEPLVLAVGLYAVAAAAMQRQWLWVLSIGLCLGVGVVSLHLPGETQRMRVAIPDNLRALRGCAVLPQSIRTPVRVVTWSVDPSADLTEAISRLGDQRPDLVVLTGIVDPSQTQELARQLDGEVKTIEGDPGFTTIVRGNFQYCGGQEDIWTVDLPGNGRLALTFPYVKGAGTLPVMVVQLPKPGGASRLSAWTQQLLQGVEHVARTAQLVGTRRMVVVGNFQAPSRAQVMAQPMLSSGLRAVHTPPNWPAQLGGLPFPTLHALDHFWTGPAWHAQRTRALDASGQARVPLLVDLSPVEIQAG